jgi:hypothetical protein
MPQSKPKGYGQPTIRLVGGRSINRNRGFDVSQTRTTDRGEKDVVNSSEFSRTQVRHRSRGPTARPKVSPECSAAEPWKGASNTPQIPTGSPHPRSEDDNSHHVADGSSTDREVGEWECLPMNETRSAGTNLDGFPSSMSLRPCARFPSTHLRRLLRNRLGIDREGKISHGKALSPRRFCLCVLTSLCVRILLVEASWFISQI